MAKKPRLVTVDEDLEARVGRLLSDPRLPGRLERAGPPVRRITDLVFSRRGPTRSGAVDAALRMLEDVLLALYDGPLDPT